MMSRGRLRPICLLQKAATLALLLPFLIGSTLSSNVMLTRDAAGVVMVVICTGEGEVEMALDLAPDQTAAAKPRCDWAAGHLAALDLTAPVALPRLLRRLILPPPLRPAHWTPAHDPRNLWARGPPRLA
jgi:hypothetical protein